VSFGVYVHIPFCASRCDYCAFATWTDRPHLMPTYAAACVTEVRQAQLPPASSVFFGGGTPSLLPADLLLSILAAINREAGCEVTVECNPETVSPALLDRYLAGGVTRVSFGVQSLVPRVLAGLGRAHTPEAAIAAMRAASTAGFASWNADLIYGGHGETDDDWHATLDAVLSLDPPHVSAYALTVEPGTPLAADTARHPDDDTKADRYLMADTLLQSAGLATYEISNWARPGHQCRHNLLYWRQGNYRGVGCAAHSHQDGRRWWNVRTPDRYIAQIQAAAPVEAGSETLTIIQQHHEKLELSLRTSSGVPAAAFGDHLADLTDAHLITIDGARARLTTTGRLMANEVTIRLIDTEPSVH